jgi:hypothetical protein
MKKYYFLLASILLLFLSLWGFSDNLVTDVGQKSNSDPKFIIHGLFCFAWFIILVVQTTYITKGSYRAHINLGVAGMVAAIGVFITTVYIFIVIYNGWHKMEYTARCNRMLMPSFALLVGLGYRHRKNADTHKRLMYVASLYMLAPILGRAMGHSFLDTMIPVTAPITWDVTLFGIWTLFFISLFLFDWTTSGKIHQVSSLGFVWFLLVWTVAILT